MSLEKIEALLAEIEASGDEAARERARALVAGLLELHGAALAELCAAAGAEKVRELARREPLVGAVLVLHGLHPDETAAEKMLEGEKAPGFVPVGTLRKKVSTATTTHEPCELCGAGVGDEHAHVLEGRTVRCVCTACALRFADDGATKIKRVSTRVDRLADVKIGSARWQALGVPVGVAFFVQRDGAVTAVFPGPAGIVESQPAAPVWEALVGANPVLAELAPETEALLVDRTRGEERCWRASIDVCWKVAGIFRAHGHGLGGGAEAWSKIDDVLGAAHG